jgi:hypothetical protein
LIQARQIVNTAMGYYDRVWALGAVAEEQARCGDVAQALKTTNAIKEPGMRVMVLTRVAIDLAKTAE